MSQTPPPLTAPPRLVPHRPLPPYTYVPGLNIHPNHPGGHSYGKPHPVVTFDPERWWDCEEYLFGFDLFNATVLTPLPGQSTTGPPPEVRECSGGYYWEAHEAWEACWHAVGRKGVVADVLKGLIRLAACGVKAREGRRDGVTGHAAAAARLFRGVAGEGGSRIGLDAMALAKLASGIKTAEMKIPVPAGCQVFGFVLAPRRWTFPRCPEVIDDVMAEVYRNKTPAERLEIASRMWRSARDLIRADVVRTHPDFDEAQIRRAVAQRMSHGAT